MLQIRSFREADIPFALEQTSREGWDSTRASFRALLEHDADGCFVAELGGQPVGLITTTRYRGPTLAPGDPQAVYGLASGAIG